MTERKPSSTSNNAEADPMATAAIGSSPTWRRAPSCRRPSRSAMNTSTWPSARRRFRELSETHPARPGHGTPLRPGALGRRPAAGPGQSRTRHRRRRESGRERPAGARRGDGANAAARHPATPRRDAHGGPGEAVRSQPPSSGHATAEQGSSAHDRNPGAGAGLPDSRSRAPSARVAVSTAPESTNKPG